MRRVIGVLFLLIFVLSANAQMTPEQQKKLDEAKAKLKAMQSDPRIAAKMKQAQQMLDSMRTNPKFQKQMQLANHNMDSVKQKNPSVGNVKMPDVNSMNVQNIKMPDISALETRVNASNQRLQGYMQVMDQATPKANLASHAESLPKLNGNNIVTIANTELKIAASKLDIISLNTLNGMVKNPKINLASTGVFLLATGGSKYAGAYLICSAIIKNPKDTWAINDLGIYYRDQSNYPQSLQCYFYANSLDTGRSPIINANIGWAAAYYGDFGTGNKYFDKALAIDNNFNNANEGKAMIAFAKGDYQALLACLAKEIKFWGGGGTADNGPSDAFSSSSTTAISKNNMQHDRDNNSDPDSDHTYDNSDMDDSTQDPPPGADDDVTYPVYKKIFVNDGKDLLWIGKYFYDFEQSSTADLIRRSKDLKQRLGTLRPLNTTPYRDDGGDLVIPNNFQKFVAMMTSIEDLFEKKVGYYKQDFEKKIKPITMDVFNHDEDMVKQYMKELGACPPDNPAHDRCVAEVNCTWIPKMHKSKNNDLEMISETWEAYYTRVSNAIQWYINATAPLVSRVHEVGWNGYLNDYRQFIIRRAIVESYGEWGNGLHTIVNGTGVLGVIQVKPPDCPPVEMSVNAPDPFSKKPKHIKEFEGPCYDHTYGFGIGVEETCHSSKFFIGGGPFKAFYEHMNDPMAAQNNNYTHKIGTDVSVSKDIDIVKIGDKTVVSASAGIEGKIEAQFNDNWQLTGGSSSIGGSADIAGLNLGGIEASRTMEVVDGQMNISPLQVKTSGPPH